MPPLTDVLEAMRAKGIAFDAGLTSSEFQRIEGDYGFQFPPDLREFLSMGLPVADDFPNWRTGMIKLSGGAWPIVKQCDWPYKGMCFDIEKNGFWMRDWGPKPGDLQASFDIARKMIRAAPRLIPIFSHRFLPGEPLAAGSPVISVYGTDIIYFGRDLYTYLTHEFQLSPIDHAAATKDSKLIRFWSDIIEQTDNVVYAPANSTQ